VKDATRSDISIQNKQTNQSTTITINISKGNSCIYYVVFVTFLLKMTTPAKTPATTMGLFGATPQATNTFSTTPTTFGAPITFGAPAAATGQQMFGVPTAVSATTMTPFGNPSA
jgi:hypothetical protein